MAACGISNRGVGMGIGTLGNPNVLIKRKFRWTLEWVDETAFRPIIPESFVKLAARPNMIFEEAELINGISKCWIPGKPSWEEITVTYFDVRNDEGGALFAYWMAQQYQRESNQPIKLDVASAILRLYDGCGYELESWTLENAFVTKLSFGDLDYVSDDEIIEATIRYSRVRYENNCPAYLPAGAAGAAGAALGMGVGLPPAPPPAWQVPGPPAAPQM